MDTIGLSGAYTPVALIQNQELNQAEPAGMKNFQNSRHIREGISNPVTLQIDWAGLTVDWSFMYIFLDICRIPIVLSYVRTHSRANPAFSIVIWASFKRQSKDSDDIWVAFQLNSLYIEIDSGSNRNAFDVHSAHSRRIRDILAGFEVACPFRFSFEGD